MINMLFLMVISLIIPSLLITIFHLYSMNIYLSWKDRETSSPFECGFMPMTSARLPFSLRFFLLAVLFVIFDAEIVILMPISVIMKHMTMVEYIMPLVGFIMILAMGLAHEWNEGSLDWMEYS